MTLTDLIGASRCLLIDFDGPICSVFAGYPASTVADELRGVVRRRLGDELPPTVAELDPDPLQILIAVAGLEDEQLTREIADASRDAEIRAAKTAAPTAGADEVLRAARAAGRRIGIVSNNTTAAIRAYLQNHDLIGSVDVIAARYDSMDPHLLKPHPFLLEQGLTLTNAIPATSVFIGDSVTDIEAGRAASIPTIGYANKPGKLQRLTDAGADIVIDSMHELAKALHEIGPEAAE